MNSLTNLSEQYWRSISKTVKTAFFTACIVGFIAHSTVLTNLLYNHDSLSAGMMTNSLGGVQQGKWFSVIVGLITRGRFFSSSATIIIGLFLLAFTAALTVSILDIKSRLWAAGIASFLVLFPSVMSTNAYLSTATFYSALLLAALAVFFTVRYKYGYLPGILLLTLSCGTYSVFIGYASGLFLILIINASLDGKKPGRKIVLTGLKYLAVLLLSALLYYVVLKIVLQIFSVTLSEYRNIDNVGSFTPSSLIQAIFDAYRKVYYFFIYGIHLYRASFSIEPMFRVMNWATIAFAAIFSISIGIRNGILKSIPRILWTVLLMCLFSAGNSRHRHTGPECLYALDHDLPVCPCLCVYAFVCRSFGAAGFAIAGSGEHSENRKDQRSLGNGRRADR